MQITYKTLNHSFLRGIILESNTDTAVTQTETNNQNSAVKSLALKLFSIILPNSSISGHPQPSQLTTNCSLTQLYGTSKIANNKSGVKSITALLFPIIQIYSLIHVRNLIPIYFLQRQTRVSTCFVFGNISYGLTVSTR